MCLYISVLIAITQLGYWIRWKEKQRGRRRRREGKGKERGKTEHLLLSRIVNL